MTVEAAKERKRERARAMRVPWLAVRRLRRSVLMPSWECFVGKERRTHMVADNSGDVYVFFSGGVGEYLMFTVA